MNITLLGYGRMGKAIETEATLRGHHISYRVDLTNESDAEKIDASNTDVVIEFTHPNSFEANVRSIMAKKLPLVSGTTGWYDKMDQIKKIVQDHNGTFLFGANFSVGVNMFFMLNQFLAQLMNRYEAYDCFIEERHHNKKADAPSGTAISLANQLLEQIDRKRTIATADLLHRPPTSDELSIGYVRSGNIAGKHTVSYTSEIDDIEITHTAHNRRGFALGAVLAAEWIEGKKGWFNFTDIFPDL